MKPLSPTRAFGIALALPQLTGALLLGAQVLGSITLVVLTTHRKAAAWAS